MSESYMSSNPTGFIPYYKLESYGWTINEMIWSPDGNLLALSNDKFIRFWNPQTYQFHPWRPMHSGVVSSMSWSPDGNIIASGVSDNTIRLWDFREEQLKYTLSGHFGPIRSISWSPDGTLLASGSSDRTVRFWNVHKNDLLHRSMIHKNEVTVVAWSPDGTVLASGDKDGAIWIWESLNPSYVLQGHTRSITSISWSPNSHILATGSNDRTIRLWDIRTKRLITILEGHTDTVTCVSYSPDHKFLASESRDNTFRLWHIDTGIELVKLNVSSSDMRRASSTFHPTISPPVVGTFDSNSEKLYFWQLNVSRLLNISRVSKAVSYRNAKVVIVGESGVGKSALSLVLTGQRFVPTYSTHGRRVSTFDTREDEVKDGGNKETREILLWDLAGQPGYRLIHQLHLNDVAVALVVFDAHSDTDPFSGVEYWNRALHQAQQVQGNTASALKKLLVAARIDRGGVGVSSARIEILKDKLDFDGYFETSAKESWQVAELKEAIRYTIDWDALPKVSSPDLFQRIKAFIMMKKETGLSLLKIDALYNAFLESEKSLKQPTDLRAQFETCVGRLESQDLVLRLSFGNLVLLRPEMLDAYAAALVNAVKDEPDGLGHIQEERVQTGEFRMPKDERLKDKEQEKLLLIAMIEDLLKRELVLREVLREETFLIFPSQSTRENPDMPDPDGKAVVFAFEGPILNIYATLAVRLSHSSVFKKIGLWKNAVTYTTNNGGLCGIFLRNIGEGRGELTIFFDKSELISEESCMFFEEYVYTHLQRRVLEGSLKRRRVFVCEGCGFIVTDQIVKLRKKSNFDWVNCIICEKRISLVGREEQRIIKFSSRLSEMDIIADNRRDYEVAISTVQGKIETKDFDVFLCYNEADKLAVKKIGEQLKKRGILPWLDEWELRPGLAWQRVLEDQIKQIKSSAVFVGKDGIGPWQRQELDAFLREFVDKGRPVIPVLLEDATNAPPFPLFLKGLTWVDFRKLDPSPMKQLIWGITGKKDID